MINEHYEFSYIVGYILNVKIGATEIRVWKFRDSINAEASPTMSLDLKEDESLIKRNNACSRFFFHLVRSCQALIPDVSSFHLNIW